MGIGITPNIPSQHKTMYDNKEGTAGPCIALLSHSTVLIHLVCFTTAGPVCPAWPEYTASLYCQPAGGPIKVNTRNLFAMNK